MAPSESQKKASLKWDKENMTTLGCKVKKEEAVAFKEYCDDCGKTSNTVLKEYVQDCIRKNGGVKMLTVQAWEKRMRRALDKYGMKLHKSREKNGGYTVTVEQGISVDLNGDERWFADLGKVQDFVEFMMEKYDGM